ncbi:SDR family NAD(P)-dependent oxidoreductase [Stackebrandtia nassauensis]|uniref:Short-chain dehydrogenase/reductase SDR n=1 Tax=Stackebrandtia nassauensis (strain DSM 44728 / CIP 108903 / NRRL B-16338 / NBRC 102104 / LLR-40K-21) TaxID=446470 RepID=D3Q7K9_STANL|nr:SDR family oxidoreductase [Stackebrandtia nassauensis]ADD44351.1 short-chain dehydrogenase/reductase SDR [Stackebrandtia nassauensis DSM 44728]
MDMGLSGRPALITGSSGGIGAEIARSLATEGCPVLVHGRGAESARRVAERLRASGATAEVVLGDVTDAADAERVAEAARGFGVRILVNNTGPFSEHSWETSTPDDWRDALDSNVVATVRLTQALLPVLRSDGWGRVITIGSRANTTPLPNMVEYSAAKAAVVNLTTSLAQHLAGSGVTANCVSPGVILTDSARRMFETRAASESWPQRDWPDIEARVASEYAPNPSGRLGRAEDIAAAVTYLASPLADYVNGVELRVDGGITGTPLVTAGSASSSRTGS